MKINSMKKTILCILVALSYISFDCFAAGETTERSEDFLMESARPLLINSITTIINSDAGRKYFNKVNENNIQINSEKSMASAQGKILRWEYRDGVSTKKNTDRDSPLVDVLVMDNDKSILFELFITSGNGGAMVSRTETINVSSKPIINIGYYLKTKSNDEALMQTINSTCEDLKNKLYLLLFKPKSY